MRMPVTRISAAAGLTRPTVYDLRSRPSQLEPELQRFAIQALLATARWMTTDEIAGLLGLPVNGVMHTLAWLAGNDRVLASSAGQLTPDAPFKLLANGETALRTHLESLRGRLVEGYSFYIEVEEADKRAVDDAARALLDNDKFDLMDAHVAHTMRMPELAFIVGADSDREAFEIAHEIWDQILNRAGLPPQLPRITLALPPRSRR